MTTTAASLRSIHLAALLSLFSLFQPGVASAQPTEPIGPFAADLRVVLPLFKDDLAIADAIGVGTVDLPSRGLGLAAGAHWYPLRGKVALGVGGELLMSGAARTNEPLEGATVAPPSVSTRFRSFSPQVSLNFGTGRGWSYLTGGLGWGSYTTERDEAPVAAADARPRVLNYGGGARWFAKEHVALTLDLRFYSIAAQDPAPGRPAYPSMRLMIFSGGVSFK